MKYLLHVNIDTDDDCKLAYLGKSYCYYGDNLIFGKVLNTKQECYDYLKTEVIIFPGYKLSEHLADKINEFIALDKKGIAWCPFCGNADVNINITEVADDFAEETIRNTCASCIHFQRSTWKNADGSIESQLGGKCPLLLRILQIDNSKLIFVDSIYVQDTFGCSLFRDSRKENNDNG
jgi:hypothetical protein